LNEFEVTLIHKIGSRIGQAASTGSLPEKMAAAEHAKAETDCQLNEKVTLVNPI
jgi:hypothetical protein